MKSKKRREILKKSWKIIKAALGKIQDKECVEPSNVTKEKSNELNKFFATIGLEIKKNFLVFSQKLQPQL